MKRNEIKTVAALLVAVILLAAILLAINSHTEEETAPEYLLSVNEADFTSLNFANGTDYVYLEKENGTWKMSDDPTFSVDQEAVATAVKSLVTTKVTGKINIESQSRLNDYSLLSPQCVIEYSLKNGSTGIIRIGTMSSLTEELYVLMGEDFSTVYITSNEMAQAFSAAKLDFLRRPDIPTPSDGHEAVEITNTYGTVRLYKEDGKWYIQKEDGPAEVSDDTAYNYYFLTWDMHWRGTVEHNAKDLSKYDLSLPRISYSLTYKQNGVESTFDLQLGSSLPDGTCYAKLKDSNDIFLLDSIMADWLESTKEGDFQ